MSSTNCFLPNSGFVLNFLVRMVNSLMAAAVDAQEKRECEGAKGIRSEAWSVCLE